MRGGDEGGREGREGEREEGGRGEGGGCARASDLERSANLL